MLEWHYWEVAWFLTLLGQFIATVGAGVMLGRDPDRSDQEEAIALMWPIRLLTLVGLPHPVPGVFVQLVSLPLGLWLVILLIRMQQWKVMWLAAAGSTAALCGLATWLPRLLLQF